MTNPIQRHAPPPTGGPARAPYRGSRRLVLAGLVTFIALGAAQGLYGLLIPDMRERLGLSSSRAGLVVSLHFIGVLLGMAYWSWRGRRSFTLVAAASLIGLGVGALVIAVAGDLALVLAAAGLIGFCTGTTDVGFNSLFARLPGPSGRRLTALSGCFAVGAVLGPAAAGVLGGTAVPFLAVAVLSVATLSLLQRMPALEGEGARPLRRAGGALVLTAGGVMLLYMALEANASSWAATHLIGRGGGEAAAAFWTAGFWGALAIGRLLGSWLLGKADPLRVILVSLLVAAACSALLFGPVPEAGYLLLGLAISPVFPMTVAWMVGRLGMGERVFAGFFMMAMGSPVLVSAAIGMLVDARGSGAVPVALAAVLAAAFVTAALARFMTQEAVVERA